jgi:hypothetical protein
MNKESTNVWLWEMVFVYTSNQLETASDVQKQELTSRLYSITSSLFFSLSPIFFFHDLFLEKDKRDGD